MPQPRAAHPSSRYSIGRNVPTIGRLRVREPLRPMNHARSLRSAIRPAHEQDQFRIPAPPAALGCLIVVDEQLRACWLGSHLSEQGGYLPAMVTGMVEHMKHLPPKRIGVAFASGIGVRNVIVEAVRNQGLNVLVL